MNKRDIAERLVLEVSRNTNLKSYEKKMHVIAAAQMNLLTLWDYVHATDTTYFPSIVQTFEKDRAHIASSCQD